MTPPPSWQVLLIGGAAGVGKSSAASRLARHCAVGLAEVDDFQRMLERMTTPEQYLAVHAFNQDSDGWLAMSEASKVEALAVYGAVVSTGLEPVIRNHLDNGISTIYEGDFLLPSFSARRTFGGHPAMWRVSGVFIVEDEDQINLNFASREGSPSQIVPGSAVSIARGSLPKPASMARWSFPLAPEPTNSTGLWTSAAERGPYSDAAGWDKKEYYSAIQLGDVDGDDTACSIAVLLFACVVAMPSSLSRGARTGAHRVTGFGRRQSDRSSLWHMSGNVTMQAHENHLEGANGDGGRFTDRSPDHVAL